MGEPGSRKIALGLPVPFLLDSSRGHGREHAEDHQKVMMTRTRTRQRFTKERDLRCQTRTLAAVEEP